ncbi:MAG: DUF58 domain-containing protein [Anaerolineae bacterium]
MGSRERLLELRNALPFLIWLVSLAVALNSGWIVAYRLLYLFTALIILGLFWSGGAVWSLAIEREPLSRMLHVGEDLVERIRIRNRAHLPQLWVVVEDLSRLPFHRMRQVLSYIPPRAVREFTVSTLAVRRGRFQLGPFALTGGDPFGIFRTRRLLASGGSVVVYPRVFHLPALDQLTGVLQADGRRSQRSPDPTTDVSTVRDYRPGDELARIHWLSSARQGRLMSKEFEDNPGGDIWVVLDLHQPVQAGSLLELDSEETMDPADWPLLEPATEEYVVSLGASVASYFIRADRAVGFVAHARQRLLFHPDRGERQLGRIMDLLAVVEPDGRVPLDRLLERDAPLFRRYDTVIVVTPSDRPEWVAAAHALSLRGIRVLAIVVDRASFAGAPAKADIRGLLSARRIPFSVVENGQRPDEAVFVSATKAVSRARIAPSPSCWRTSWPVTSPSAAYLTAPRCPSRTWRVASSGRLPWLPERPVWAPTSLPSLRSIPTWAPPPSSGAS